MPTDDRAYLTDLVRTTDRPRYYATLFAPEACRADLFAIYGFAAEIARVPTQIREPQLGEIRLQWWLDSLDSALASDGGDAPAIRQLAQTIRRRSLPAEPFRALIDARRADLYSDPPADRGELEGRLGETESSLFQLAALVLGSTGPETADASGHAGIAYGLARSLVRFHEDRLRSRTVIPLDILREQRLGAAEALALNESEAMKVALDRTTELAWDHLERARTSMAQIQGPVALAFLPLATIGPLITRLYRMGVEAGPAKTALSDLENLLLIAWAWFRQSRAGRKDRS